MIKHGYVLFASLLVVGVSSVAKANGWYVEGFTGSTFPTTISNSDEVEFHSDTALYGGVAVGKRFDNINNITGLNLYGELATDLRMFELHGLNTNNQYNSATGDLLIWNTSLNGAVGYEVTEQVELIALAGVGVAMLDGTNIKSKNLNEEFDDTIVALSYNVGASVLYHITDTWQLSAGYRYTDIPSYDLGDYNGDLASHSFLLGVRYSF